MTEDVYFLCFSSVKKVYTFIYCIFQILKEVHSVVTELILFYFCTDAENGCSSADEKIYGVNLQNICTRTATSARTTLKTCSS